MIGLRNRKVFMFCQYSTVYDRWEEESSACAQISGRPGSALSGMPLPSSPDLPAGSGTCGETACNSSGLPVYCIVLIMLNPPAKCEASFCFPGQRRDPAFLCLVILSEEISMLNKITIVGLGAMGILFGDLAVKNLGPDRVCFLANGDRLERYRREGARCNGETCEFRFSDGSDGPAELLIFAVKAPDLADAMELAAPVVDEDTVIISLLNGVTSEEILEQTFGGDKVLYTVTQGMDAVRVGNELTYHTPGRMFLGIPQEDYFDREDKVDAALNLLQQAGLPFVREEDILHRMWCKFMLNVGVNQVCMAYETDYGAVQEPGELRDLMIAAMDEARKVGACQGVLVTQKDRTEYLAVMDALHPRGIPSMRQDGLAHRRTEVDLFAGAVLEMAGRYGMQAPVNRMLYDRIKAMEASW